MIYKVSLKRREVYGVHRYYPMNDLAIMLCEILEKKTLNEKHLDLLRDNKWEIEFVNE